MKEYLKKKLKELIKKENYDKALDMIVSRGIKSKEEYELVETLINLKFEDNEEIKKVDLEKALKVVEALRE